MHKIAIILMLLGTLLVSCQTRIAPEGPWVKKIDSEELSRLVINFSTKMKIEKHLELEDSWAAYDDTISKICLRYSSQRLLTVYDARLILVELVEDFLYRLNNHTILSFELNQYPFTALNLDVKIDFQSYYGRFVDEQYVGLVWLQAGCSHFYAFDRKDPSLISIDWSHDRFEPYFKSRELALLKRQADIPYIEQRENPNPPPRASNYVYERYFSPAL